MFLVCCHPEILLSWQRDIMASLLYYHQKQIFHECFFSYICFQGGWDGSVHLNSGEVYEPEIDQWSFIAPASTARWDAGISVESDKIYIVGGCDRNALCTLETECYDPEKNKWSKVASLPVATHGLKCCTIQLPHKFSKQSLMRFPNRDFQSCHPAEIFPHSHNLDGSNWIIPIMNA